MGHSSSHLLPCTICSQHCTEWSLNGNFIRWPTILSPLPPSPSTHSLKIFKFSIVKRQNLTWSMSTVALRFLQANSTKSALLPLEPDSRLSHWRLDLFGHALHSPSLPTLLLILQVLVQLSLSTKSFFIISTRSYPISRSLNIYHQPCCSIMAVCYTLLSWHHYLWLDSSKWKQEPVTLSPLNAQCLVWCLGQRIPKFSEWRF